MGINENPTIVFSVYENKLRKWWVKLEDNGTEDDLREKKRLLLLLAHPTFKDDLNSCLEKIYLYSKKAKSISPQFNIELRIPCISDVSSKWNISFSNSFYNYIIQNKCTKVEDFDFEVTKHIYAHDFFFNARMLSSGFRSYNGLEISRLFAAKSDGFKNSLFLEINVNSPNLNEKTLWVLLQKSLATIHSIQKETKSKHQSKPKALRFPKRAIDQTLNMERLKIHLENKYNDEYTEIRLSRKGAKTANRKSYDEIFAEISKLRLNYFERDLAIHYFKYDKAGNFNSIEAIDKEGEFYTKIGTPKKWRDKLKNLYFFIDPLVSSLVLISKRSK